MIRIAPALLAAGALALGLTACGPRVDPCSQPGVLPAPTAEQIAKVQRGLEVDESIEVNGGEVECVLVESNVAGQFVWVSEYED